MKKTIAILGIFSVIMVIYLFYYYDRSIKYQAFTGMVTLEVVDYEGNIVSNANVEVGFANASANNRCVRKGKTDAEGLFFAKGVSDGDIIYTITKEEYYQTRATYWFSRGGTERSKWFPWILKFTPWNPTLTVVLKRIHNPIPMQVSRPEIILNQKGKTYGFDLFIGDLVEPYGKGDTADFEITYSSHIESSLNFSNCLVIASAQSYGGFQLQQKDMYSEYKSQYDAPDINYTNKIVLTINRTAKKIIDREIIDNSEYLIFRTRCIADKNGIITNAYYGKIYGAIDYGDVFMKKGVPNTQGSLYLQYYLNPTPNDKNLEYAPEQNLIDYSDLRFPPKFEP